MPETNASTAVPVPVADFPPIGDYGFIGDGRSGALISRSGNVEWLCLPNFYNDAVFAAVLDRQRGGCFSVRPVGEFEVRRRYLGDSAVLETEFRTPRGVLRLRDCMVIIAGSGLDRELHPARELLRELEVIEGEVEVRIRFEPRPAYGARRAHLQRRGRAWVCTMGTSVLGLHSALPLRPRGDRAALEGRARLRPGQRHYLSLCNDDQDLLVVPPLQEAAQRIEATRAWWRRWCEACSYRGAYPKLLLRSAITLKLLTFALSGAVVAAPTTSLPEAVGKGRNWDYRYCWLRDAGFTLRVFLDLGYFSEGADFLNWLVHATRLTWPELRVLYDVHGKQPPAERVLEHLSGYRESRPVRVSNGARDQLQLDVYGELILAVYDYVVRGGSFDRYAAKLLKGFGATVMRRWREPDHGIWEIRGEPRQYTYSKLMCWVALDCLLRLHGRGQLEIDVERVTRERDAIAAAIEARGFNRALGAYVGEFGGDRPDAALLQLSRVGYIEPDHPKMEATAAFIRKHLEHNGLLLRYGGGFDGLQGKEGAFGVCSFWLVSYLVRSGHCEEARRLFEHMLDYANDLGLYAEEIDPDSGEQLGNFPQAFTHVGLIDAALALAGEGSGEEERHDA